MSPTEADRVIATITARLTRLTWTPEVWTDLREQMIRLKIDGDQGVAAAKNLIINAKTIPTPGHFLEAFRAAVATPTTTGSPRTEESGYRGEFWHPRGWAIVRGWMWMRREENWPQLPAMMDEYAKVSGLLFDWEAIIGPNPPGPFTSEQVEALGLWVNERTRKVNPRGSYDHWAAKQREDQERRVKIIADLRKQRSTA